MAALPARSFCAFALGASLALPCAAAAAHELLIKPPAGRTMSPGRITLTISNGDIDSSTITTTRDSLASLAVYAGNRPLAIAPADWTTGRLAATLTFTAASPATYLLTLATRPKLYEVPAVEFRAYVRDEDIEVPLAADTGKLTIRESYSKYAISILQVGARQTDDYRRPIDAPMQIRLRQNPISLRPGAACTVQVLFHGKPLAGQLLLGGYEGYRHDAKGQPVNLLRLHTDVAGRAAFQITHAGRWYVYLVHMRPVRDGTADYESFYATTLFDVAGGTPAP